MPIVVPSSFAEMKSVPGTYDLCMVAHELGHSWRLILGSALGAAFVLFGLSFLIHDSYKATTIVMPPSQTSSTLSMLSAATANSSLPAGALAAFGMKTPTDLYVALMSTPAVEDAVIRHFDLQRLYKAKHLSEARKRFESKVQVKAEQKSGLISIAVTDLDPNRAAQIANGIVESFDDLSAHLAITDAARRRLFFEKQVAETKHDVTTAEENLSGTMKRTGIIEPQGDARAMIAYEAELHAQITAKKVELQSMKVYLSDENPQVQTAIRSLQSLETQADGLNRKSQGGDITTSKDVATDASLAYLRDLRELRYNESLLELLLKNLEIAKLDEAREGNLVQVVSAATPPDMKYGPHRSIFLACGFVLGLLFSSAWTLTRR